MEKKIEALPSLSLEEFQQKKKQQRSKKTKFVQKSHKNHSNVGRIDTKKVTTVKNDFDEDECMLVGSKKRKARKQNITRNAALATAGESSGAKGQNDNKRTFYFFVSKLFFTIFFSSFYKTENFFCFFSMVSPVRTERSGMFGNRRCKPNETELNVRFFKN